MTDYEIPCVIVHRGYKPYLKYNLEITAKNNRVFLIGDKSVEFLEKINNVTFVNIEAFQKEESIINFKNSFVNYCTQPYDFEWMTFERVFIMHKFTEKYNFNQVFHLDSDTVLLKDINIFKFCKMNAYAIPQYQDNFRMDCSIHCGLLDKEFFEQYEKLYTDIYINKTKLGLFDKKIKYHKKNKIRGGICDMTLYYLLQSEGLLNPQNLMEEVTTTEGKEYIFMNNINLSEGFYGLKNYELRGNKIKIYKRHLVKDIINNKMVRIANIHYQGTAKKKLNYLTKYTLKY